MRWRLALMTPLVLLLGILGQSSLLALEGSPRDTWAFQTPKRPPLPQVQLLGRIRNSIDAFVLERLEANGLGLNADADRQTLLRRVYFDLIGLPPSVEEQEAFLADTSADAYERLVDRLLASPRYGERWAQHWLDVVRYAETDGFKADDHRPNAHKYRDYVIDALNRDLPYDQFIQQQLAGDELEPHNPQALIATGFNRLWPDEYNAANLEQRRQEILDDVTEVTGLTFLGLTIGCAKCHDHKFDPLPQKDFYRLQAFFAPMRPRDEVVDEQAKEQYQRELAAWEDATRELREEMDSLMADKREEMRKQALTKFRQEIQDAVLTPAEKRTPYQQQIALMAEQQIQRAESEAATKLSGEKKKRFQDLEKQMGSLGVKRPAPPEGIMAIGDVGRTPPPTHLLTNGDWRKPAEELQPGFPGVLATPIVDIRQASTNDSTGRRAVLAQWLTRQDHPLTARVMVNRLWQHHFGLGIVGTPNDFGSQGEPPTHPELLDWLAVEFVEQGWSLKHMHRLMVTSAGYRQSALVDLKNPAHAQAAKKDPENKLLWHARRKRLEGEIIRDAMLAVSGELNDRMFGASARPKLPDGISKYAWKPDSLPKNQNRRSVYVYAKRNMRYPLFDTFDLPDMHNSCARRSQTTTPPQALLLLNGEFTQEQAQRWAGRLMRQSQDECSLVETAYREAWGRRPTEDEIAIAQRFLQRQTAAGLERSAAVADFCHAVLNSNEFLYVD